MQTDRTRITLISAATLALVLAGTAAASAHGGGRDEPPGIGLGRMGMGMGGPGWDDMDGFGMGRMGHLGGLFDEDDGGFVRTVTTYQADDGTVVSRRIDQGTVSAAGETSLDYALATGEAGTVTTDSETEIVSLGVETVDLGNSGRTRERLVPESLALADIPVGATVLVWAEAQADGSYLAERIVVRPAAEDATDTDAADAEGEITEVPASPLPADA